MGADYGTEHFQGYSHLNAEPQWIHITWREDGTADDLWALCMRAYYAADPVQRQDKRTRWVMDLAHYKRIRAVSEAYSDHKTDPETWIPDPGDQLCAIPIDVRDDGGEPHLETPAWAPAPAELAAAAERLRVIRSTA